MITFWAGGRACIVSQSTTSTVESTTGAAPDSFLTKVNLWGNGGVKAYAVVVVMSILNTTKGRLWLHNIDLVADAPAEI
jgi:hypothetical protein